ncbi:hypothetical protein HYFRA_00009595 [Hymenoscyphus fraxineus]|uniref:Carrier domain-containing protein n=1 Tax=Hymenoscyphus fraxineus TaxID=746836 RepID=A0A9N9PQD0_9HELO|nr:hypothetical protein HYFRA_00009595 [Hymenoscyphus fraxineus]
MSTILTDLIRNGQTTRSSPCVLIASPKSVTEEIFLSDLENASNRAAEFLGKELPIDQKTFFYMGPSDMRYFIWVLAAMKTEKCVMFPSPGNTIPSNQRLFKTVGAKTLLYPPEGEQMLAPLLETIRGEVKSIVTPSYSELMSKEPTPIHALNKSFEEVKDVPVLGLHTSGTSGHPKPIYWTHGSIAALASHSESYGVYSEEFKSEGNTSLLQDVFAPGEVVMMPFPLYHMGGISPVFFSILYGNTHVMPATGTKMTSENITGMLRASKSTTAWLAPSLLEDMMDDPSSLEILATMKHVVFGGGPMNPTKGNKLSKVIPHLCGFIGSTEGGACHLVSPPDSSHWNEFNFIDVGQKMEEVEEGLFELVYPNTELTRRCQLHFHSYPELSEYRTKDLFISVPGKKGWWTYRGRTDNWVVMSNALKMDPTDIENTVGSHPAVKGVLVAGDRRYRLCLLVELRESFIPTNETEREEILNQLWPSIEEANQSSTKYGRIPRELVYFATREKAFLRASKGTIQRRLTIEAHAQEIDDLYAKAEQGLLTKELPRLETLDQESIQTLLQHLYSEVLELDGGLGVNDDILASGIDSFGTMTISSRLKAALRKYGVSEAKLDLVSVKNLYSAVTIQLLAKTLVTALSVSDEDITPAQVLESNTTRNDILTLIEKYRAKAQSLVKNTVVTEQSTSQSIGDTVLLTGSTGSLGTYILDVLLARPDIKKVICLNRGHDGMERQAKSLESRKFQPLLQVENNKNRVIFLEADLKNERLGLSVEDYATVTRETTVIVHNAYPVNFLMSIWQFEPQMRGLLNLMQLSLDGNASLMFVSSISTGMSATGKRQHIPEILLDTATQVGDLLPQGYAQSKYVCEQMLEAFSDSLATRPVSVLRVGQICGPRLGDGPWNKWEWFPSLVISSRFLGVAPDDIGQEINWIPVDELASIVSDLIDYTHTKSPEESKENSKTSQVFNVVNPKMSTWKSLLPAVQTALPATVTVSEWLAILEASVEKSAHLLDQNPGAKLVDFYQGGLVGSGGPEPVYEVEKLIQASSTAAKLEPVTQSDVKKWMGAWF